MALWCYSFPVRKLRFAGWWGEQEKCDGNERPWPLLRVEEACWLRCRSYCRSVKKIERKMEWRDSAALHRSGGKARVNAFNKENVGACWVSFCKKLTLWQHHRPSGCAPAWCWRCWFILCCCLAQVLCQLSDVTSSCDACDAVPRFKLSFLKSGPAFANLVSCQV